MHKTEATLRAKKSVDPPPPNSTTSWLGFKKVSSRCIDEYDNQGSSNSRGERPPIDSRKYLETIVGCRNKYEVKRKSFVKMVPFIIVYIFAPELTQSEHIT